MLQVLRRHHDAEFHIGLEGEEPRLGQHGNFRVVRDVHDEDGAALAVLLGEIDRLRLDGVENLADLLAHRAIFDGGVEDGMRDGDIH